MRYLYNSTKPLDERAKSKYLLSDELLMENAANALLELVRSLTHKGSVIVIVCGSGDNGADGYALARKLQGSYITRIYQAKEPKSPLCVKQSERAQVAGCEIVKKLLPCDVVVDCLFGSGFAGGLSAESIKLLEQMNACARIKIACDIPSGLDMQGRVESYAFQADYTLSMGALKTALFSDVAKDLTGKILVGDLGVSGELFEVQSPFFLLEESDMALPSRTKQNCHKGTFGHIAVVSGEKPGAAVLSALSGLRMGAGLVSMITREDMAMSYNLSPNGNVGTKASQAQGSREAFVEDARMIEIMYARAIPEHTNVLCMGMGLGRGWGCLLDPAIIEGRSCVLDADILYERALPTLLESIIAHNLVLTPHPKEFHAIVHACGLFDGDVAEVANNRFDLALAFSQAYKSPTLLLKGANTIIAHDGKLYINPLGTNALAKAGSGDVLCGIIASYLAQGFSPLESAINASLVHAQAAKRETNAYALTPMRLIDYVGLM